MSSKTETPATVSPQVPAPITPVDVTTQATGVVMYPAYAKAVAANACNAGQRGA